MTDPLKEFKPTHHYLKEYKHHPGVAGLAPSVLIQVAQRVAPGIVRTALDGGTSPYAQFVEGRQKYLNDKTANPHATLVKIAKYARAKIDPAVRAIQVARQQNAEAIRDKQRRLATPFSMETGVDGQPWAFARVLQAQAIVSHFAQLPNTKRLEAVRAAIDAKDLTVLQAIGAAPAFLSGVVPEMHAAAKRAVIDLYFPGEAAALETLIDAESAAETFERAMLQSVADMVDFASAEAFERGATEAV